MLNAIGIAFAALISILAILTTPAYDAPYAPFPRVVLSQDRP